MGQVTTAEAKLVAGGGAAKAEDRATTALPGEGKEVVLFVENMRCGGCLRGIERSLNALPSVAMARANLTTKRVRVTGKAGTPSTEALVAALAEAGYTARPFDTRLIETDEEGRRLLRALGVSGFAAANVMLLSVAVWAGLASDMDYATRGLFHWISALIAMPAVAYAGQPFFTSALQAIGHRRLNMDVPISLAVILAASVSLYQTVRGADDVYFDASVTLLFFLLIGRYLDHLVRAKARDAAQNLLLLRATGATVVGADGSLQFLPVERIAAGMTVLVAAGEQLPVDGVVAEGQSSMDTALITGESLPATVTPGDKVFAGTVNLAEPLRIRVTQVGEGTLLAEIARIMEAAEQNRSRYVRMADRAARYYSPGVHLLALIAFVGWIVAGAAWQDALMIAAAVLIITCPCALALAVPVVQVVAASRLLRQGILMKSADALERLAEIDCAVFDKTGTLTRGELQLIDDQDLNDSELAAAAAMAANSKHPLARALVRAAQQRLGSVTAATDVVELPGRGLSRPLPEGEARLGSAAWLGLDQGRESDSPELWFARPGQPPIRFAFEDALRDDATQALQDLAKRGVPAEILSGDRFGAVRSAATALSVERFAAEQGPAAKIARLECLEKEGRLPLMVGDGLNDAPALAAAHASMSPSSAADISQTAADFIFQGSHLSPVLEALDVARRSRALAVQNFILAGVYNVVAIPLAMAGYVTPLIAALAMSSSSIVVTLNALRLRSSRDPS